MTPQVHETKPESPNIESCEVRFGPAFAMNVVAYTVEKHEPPFEEIKDLCSHLPIRFNRRALSAEEGERLEDLADVADALEALKEPGGISLEDFKKQLGI